MGNNNDYFDEKVLKYIKDNEEAVQNERTDNENIQNGFIIIDKEKIPLTARCILDNQLSIFMPETFQIMDPSIAKIKYPYEDRPQEIYTNQETDINFTFHLEDNTMSSDEAEGVRDSSLELILKEMANSKFLAKGQIMSQMGEAAYLEVILKVSDMDIYCNMFFVQRENKALFGNFNCPKYEKENWGQIVKKLIESIAIV